MINKGDNTGAFGKQFLVIYLNNPLGVKFSKAVVQFGKVSKVFINPEFPLLINFTGDETEELERVTTAYLFIWDELGRRILANGSLTFKSTNIKTPYTDEATQDSNSALSNLSYEFIGASEFDAVFEVNVTPNKVSQLENDLNFQTLDDVNNLIGSHNSSEDAHPFILSEIAKLPTHEDVNEYISTHNLSEDVHPYLQSQIDAIVARADVIDIVGTYQELLEYNTKDLTDKDVIKVLQDENHDNTSTYYRWVISDVGGSWVYIGSEAPYYSKSETDELFVPQTRTINGQALSQDITLDIRNSLEELTDVSFNNLKMEDSLIYDGEKWINSPIDAYSRTEIDNLLIQKMDLVALSAPLGEYLISNTPDNVSITSTGTGYLNQNAYDTTQHASSTEGDWNLQFITGGSNFFIQISLEPDSISTGSSPSIPLNLKGYLSFVRNFTYDDIIMVGDAPCWGEGGWYTDGVLNTDRSILLGTLDENNYFTPKLHVGYYENGSTKRGSIFIVQYLNQANFSIFMQSGRLTGSFSDPNKHYLVEFQHLNGTLPAYRGIKFRKDNSSGVEKLAIDWVLEDGSISEGGVATVPLSNFGLNCALFSSYALNSKTYEGEQWTFDINEFFVANRTLDNRILNLGEVSDSKYLSLSYNKNNLEVLSEGLSVKTASEESLGIVKPDNSTINIDSSGTLSVPQERIIALEEAVATKADITVLDSYVPNSRTINNQPLSSDIVIPIPVNLTDLADINITSPSSGDALTYQDGKWVNGQSASSSSWGNITGDINAQTDLQNELNSKQTIANLVTEVSETSTDTQYPSALCIFKLIGDINILLDELNGEIESEDTMLNTLNGEVV